MENSNLIPFGGKEIRKIIHNDEWYFSVIDVIEILTDSAILRNYWSDLKRREPQLHEICVQLKLCILLSRIKPF
jgi:DNA-damage-inducible protein D